MARPKVEVREFRTNGAFGKHVAWCSEPGCVWVYVNGVKSDVQQEATYHRAKHRREDSSNTPQLRRTS